MTIVEQLDVLLQNQRRTIHWYICFATILVVLGMILLASMVIFGHKLGSDPIKTILGIGGCLISSVSVFPLKEVNGCRDRISVYRKLRAEVDASRDTDQKIELLVWDVMRKVALG